MSVNRNAGSETVCAPAAKWRASSVGRAGWQFPCAVACVCLVAATSFPAAWHPAARGAETRENAESAENAENGEAGETHAHTDAAPQSASTWLILPPTVHVSADYPARIVVLEQRPDGTTLDRTRDPDLQFSIPATLPLVWHAATAELQLRDVGTASHATAEGEVAASGAEVAGQAQPVTVSLGAWSAAFDVHIGAMQPQPPAFPREVSALLGKAGCNLGTCHGNLHGKGGFRLSLRGDDPLLDYQTVVRGDGGRRVDLLEPAASLLLKKPLGAVAHQGGQRFRPDAVEAELLRRWIEDGCQWSSGTAPPGSLDEPRPAETLVKLRVFPAQALIARERPEQQLVVTAEFADGTVRDVTRWSRFEASEVSGVVISDQGRVQAGRPMDVAISVSYLSGRSAARLTFVPHARSSGTPEAGGSWIDELVNRQLARVQLQPAPLADDATFLRRVYLVTVGRLPTAAEAREFLSSSVEEFEAVDGAQPEAQPATQPAAAGLDRRQRLVERLLHDRGFALLWAMRWSDLLRNEQKVMSSEGANGWHAWMVEQVAADRPLDEFVRDLVHTVGSTYEHPPASFHRTHRDPEAAAESIGQVFLGVRLQCARCHNHPFDVWRQDDYYGLAAYFTTIQRKQIDNQPRDQFDKHIITGDEIISLSGQRAEIWHPGRAEKIAPKPLDQPRTTPAASQSAASQSATSESITSESITSESITSEGAASEGATSEGAASPLAAAEPLETLADWLTRGNRMFARNMANRIWYHIMGRGIVDPPDDFRDSNPPSNPELLEYLTDELIRGGYSTRHLTRVILSSETFQRAAAREPDEENPISGVALFAGYPLHRMPAEVLYDALGDATGDQGEPVRGESTRKGEDKNQGKLLSQRALERAEVPTRGGFLTTFGKPNRLLVCECERSSDTSLGQSLMLVNGVETREKLASQRNRLGTLLSRAGSSQAAVEELYLATLTRWPMPGETAAMVEYLETAVDRRLALEDVLWALVNSKEFPLVP
jgi:hypothetical protein